MSAADWFKSRSILVNKIILLSKRVKQLEDEKSDALSDYNMMHHELLEKTSALELAHQQIEMQKNLLSVSEAFRRKEASDSAAMRQELEMFKSGYGGYVKY